MWHHELFAAGPDRVETLADRLQHQATCQNQPMDHQQRLIVSYARDAGLDMRQEGQEASVER